MSLESQQFVNLIMKRNSLSKENDSLKKRIRSLRWQRNTACAGLVGLAALSICSIASCRQKEAALSDAQQEKANTKAAAEYFQKNAADLTQENQRLKEYENFTHSINDYYPEVSENETNEDETLTEAETAKDEQKWFDACDVLGIDVNRLRRLKGLEK